MIKPTRIFIVGPTGAGKSLLGEALAKKLGWQYIDANPGLERYIGRNLHDILGTQGETAFHQCEAEIISHYTHINHIVVVLEEAIITSQMNRQLLSSEFVVYLQVSTKVQMERWSSGRAPLLPITDKKAFLDKQHLERDHLYEEIAKLTLDPIPVEEQIDKIIKTLEK